MIYEAMSCLAEELNLHFRNKMKSQEDVVIVSGILNQDGSIAIPAENKVVITLVNTTRDMQAKNYVSSGPVTTRKPTPVYLQLHLLISAYFSATNYSEALRFLSFVIAFIQEKNVFTHANTPRMDGAIDKLVFEMETFDTDKLNSLWATLGSKYMPSAFYRVRMITFDSSIVKEYRPVVSEVSDASLT